MSNFKKLTLMPLSLAAGLSMGAMMPAAAQNQGGLVNVNVEDNEILNELNLSVPVTVQVPIGIAANVCGIQANVLAAAVAQGQDVECDAQNNSRAFSRIVSRQTQ